MQLIWIDTPWGESYGFWVHMVFSFSLIKWLLILEELVISQEEG